MAAPPLYLADHHGSVATSVTMVVLAWPSSTKPAPKTEYVEIWAGSSRATGLGVPEGTDGDGGGVGGDSGGGSGGESGGDGGGEPGGGGDETTPGVAVGAGEEAGAAPAEVKTATSAIDSRPLPTFATVTYDLPVAPPQLNVYGPAPPLTSTSWPHWTALSFTLLPSHTAMVPEKWEY